MVWNRRLGRQGYFLNNTTKIYNFWPNYYYYCQHCEGKLKHWPRKGGSYDSLGAKTNILRAVRNLIETVLLAPGVYGGAPCPGPRGPAGGARVHRAQGGGDLGHGLCGGGGVAYLTVGMDWNISTGTECLNMTTRSIASSPISSCIIIN